MSGCWSVAALVISSLITTSAPGRAELRDEADRLARGWQAAGQQVLRVPAVFLERGRPHPIAMPDGAWRDDVSCSTVAFLAPRSADFVVRLEPAITQKLRVSNAPSERSAAGAVLIAQCGSARELLSRLTVELRGARSALETLVALGDVAAPVIAEVLPERASGPIAALIDTGARPPLAPLAARVRRAVQRAKFVPLASVRSHLFTAQRDGSGHELVQIAEGCHRVDLLADLAGRRPLDLDADLRDTASERVLARDRGDAPDVRLDFCTGVGGAADLLFAGAPGPVSVVMVDRSTPVPAGVPASWGPRARGGFARALERRLLPPVEQPPLAEWLGVAGLTAWSTVVIPGVCYVAALATTRGEPRALTLSANVDSTVVYDASTGRDDSAAIAFCAGSEPRVRVEAEVRGSAVAWVASLWRVGARPLEEPR